MILLQHFMVIRSIFPQLKAAQNSVREQKTLTPSGGQKHELQIDSKTGQAIEILTRLLCL